MSMRQKGYLLIVLLVGISLLLIYVWDPALQGQNEEELTELPAVEVEEGLGELIYNRRSIRSFTDEPLSSEDVASLLWSGEGITVDGVSGPTRSSPSAGATDPLEIYLVAGEVEGLPAGIYHYDPVDHELSLTKEGDHREQIAGAALGQAALRKAPVVVIVTADYDRTTAAYGARGERYVHIEAGHAGQNINLMAEQRGLGGVLIGAFDDNALQDILSSEPAEPLLLIPVGHPE